MRASTFFFASFLIACGGDDDTPVADAGIDAPPPPDAATDSPIILGPRGCSSDDVFDVATVAAVEAARRR